MLLEWQSSVRTFSQIWQYSIYSIKNYLSFHVAIICANFCVDFYFYFIFDDFFSKKEEFVTEYSFLKKKLAPKNSIGFYKIFSFPNSTQKILPLKQEGYAWI